MRTSVRLVASMVVAPLETERYLALAVESLAEFCDAVRVYADGGFEIVREALRDLPADVQGSSESTFWQHEGNTRQAAYEWALKADPTHVLAIDSDEFVADGAALRAACEQSDVMALCMQEIWACTPTSMTVRMDGHWRPHPVPIVWRPRSNWRIPSKEHASGRAPVEAGRYWNRWDCPTEILHVGWTNREERANRYARYANQSNFGHNAAHVRSIMWEDDRIQPCTQDWPEGLLGLAAKISGRANRMEVRT